MENSLSKAEQNALAVSYEVLGTHVELDLDFVKKYLVRGRAELTSDQEVVFFMNTCKMQGLNPLAQGEVYLIKYDKDAPAQMVVGKDAYLRRAFDHPDYLYKNDGITVQRGKDIVQKEGCCLYPGENLIGGWCRVHFIRLRFIRKTHCQKDFMLWRGSARLGGVSGIGFNILGNPAELVRKLKMNADIAVFVNLDMVYQFDQNFAGQLFDVLIFRKGYQRGMLLVNAV